MAERIDILRWISNQPADNGWKAREKQWAYDAGADMIDFIRDADCNCRPATEKYEAHTCRRCELLARIGGVE